MEVLVSIDLSAIIAACKLAEPIGGLLSRIKKHRPSDIQKELLRAASQTGEFLVIEVEQLEYPIVRAGDINMGDEGDPASLAKYFDAFKSLCEMGYIDHASGSLFRLTSPGFDKARRLG